ncbi:hypothetical protein F5X99DRAFT_381734 [Biscogniauxia marginata]|nr:hypothetical protein F5X99DRAFT_381734 [Biscogniauxia marginata]
MISPSCHTSIPPAKEPPMLNNIRSSRMSMLLEIVELIPAVASSLVTTCYILQEESPSLPFPDSDDVSIARSIFIKNTSPGLVLGSCLVLGCCLSSYAHRRRRQDQYQTTVFAVWVVWAILVSWRVGFSADMIALGVVPWALCVAMLSSMLGHSLMRWRRLRRKSERWNDNRFEKELTLRG